MSVAQAAGVVAQGIGTMPDGTAAAPSLAFLNNTGLGMYRVGANIGGLAAAGVGIVRWTSGFFYPEGDGTIALGHSTLHWKQVYMDYTVTGTVGAVTMNKPAGRVIVAAAATSIVVTNSLVTANSIILVTIAQNDSTAVIKNVVAAAGSFTITLNAAATANTAVNFLVVSTD